jgi:drug/metabolite transporter (DMT)-like permease
VIDGQLVGGVLAAAVAAACFNGAVVLYAIESRTVPSEHGLRLSLVKRLARRPRWLAAIALDAFGWPFQLLALSLAPLTVVQPTLSVGLLLLLAVGARRLGERVGRTEIVAALVIVGGVTALALAAPKHTDAAPDPLATAIVLGGLVLASAAPYLMPRRRVGAGAMILAAGAAFTATALASKLITDEIARGRWGSAVLLALGTAAVAALGLLTETSALQRFEATRVSPAVFVIQTVAPVIAAPILIGENWRATPGGGAVVVAGLLATCAGGVLLARSRVIAVAHEEGPAAAVASTSSSTTSAAAGSSASDSSGSRGDASADRSAAASSEGVDATSARPKAR